MPTYEYRCEACQYHFDAFQSILADPLKKCPNCGFRALKRLIGKGGGIIFKGSGWPGQEIARGERHESTKTDAPTGGTRPGDEPTLR